MCTLWHCVYPVHVVLHVLSSLGVQEQEVLLQVHQMGTPKGVPAELLPT